MHWRFTAPRSAVEFDEHGISENPIHGAKTISPQTGGADHTYQGRKSHMRRLLISAVVLCGAASAAHAQVELKNYADANGYIDVQKLTCAQLAGTFQEDADFLGVWYSGWYNGLAKKHAINVPRTKAGIHNVIVYCKANPARTVIQAIDVMLKEEKN
jgi:hypothetical protein